MTSKCECPAFIFNTKRSTLGNSRATHAVGSALRSRSIRSGIYFAVYSSVGMQARFYGLVYPSVVLVLFCIFISGLYLDLGTM